MARIIVRNLYDQAVEAAGASTLLAALQREKIDWMHACGGKGRCTTCKIIVHEGTEYLGEITGPENRYRLQGALASSERLACQAIIVGDGDVYISVPDEYKLPHINYSDDKTG